MILKHYQLSNINNIKSNYYLFYGENQGLKTEAIDIIKKSGFTENVYRYEESEILNNYDNFLNEITNKSFFEENKLIIISRVSEKILTLIDEIKSAEIDDVKIIISSGKLDKKSKLRQHFEKQKDLICIAFYEDDNKTLTSLAYKFFQDKKVSISREITNLLVERCRGDRNNLKNELSKIELFLKDKKHITQDQLLNLTNLAENYSFSELVDACLSKNVNKTIRIINENNFSSEDCVSIVRTFLAKSKRLLLLKKMNNENNNLEKNISDFKPPIFWKDKEIVRQQFKHWSLENIENLIFYINDIELILKKNNNNSVNLLNDFILSQVKISN
tara:strand:+ start:408 stop:1400 length:993 start_codon:yes stop_codon:yes gene_type:complete